MIVGAGKSFVHHSVDLVLLANGDRYEIDSRIFMLSGKAFFPFEILHCSNFDLFLIYIRICSQCY